MDGTLIDSEPIGIAQQFVLAEPSVEDLQVSMSNTLADTVDQE